MNRLGLMTSHSGACQPSGWHICNAQPTPQNLQIEETFFNLQETFATIAP